ncbi:MAG: ATP-dependent helicase HrpB [Granulosicoccus sp.]
MTHFPDSIKALPVMALASDIANALCAGNVLLRAQPGAGKSTALPLALLASEKLNGRIVMLEPRRLAALSVAERLASHLGQRVGQDVGLRMRFDTRVSEQTRLEVVTEGVLTRLLQDDPGLEGVGLLVFDEFHERSLHADLALALSLEVQQALRDDLRLLLMSATLDTGQLQTFMPGITLFDCAVRQHPVTIVWAGEHREPLAQRIVQTVIKALSAHEGDVLVFLPGVAEINRTNRQLKNRIDSSVKLHCLHSGISSEAQKAATMSANSLHRRVILSTSLAETSITIDGVRVVIDSGLERRAKLDSVTGAQRLETVQASQASATQRAGRAGRTAPGACYRLWNEPGHSRRAAHWQPEIRRADLAPVLMELGLWGGSGSTKLTWLEAPPQANLSKAEDRLIRLGLWKDGQLSAYGRRVALMPVHPSLGHMLLWAAQRGIHKLASRLVVLLEEQQRVISGADMESFISAPLTATQRKRAKHLERLVMNLSNTVSGVSEAGEPSAAVTLAQAFPDWIAQKRSVGDGHFRLACGAGAIIDEDDPLAQSDYLAVAQLGGAGTQLRIFKALALNISELQQYAAELLTGKDHLDWDDKRERVVAEHRLMLGELMVECRSIRTISEADKAKALLSGIRQRGLSCLPWGDDSRELQARVERMHVLPLPDGVDRFPRIDDEALLADLENWLLPWLQNMSTMKALRQLNLYVALQALLNYRQQQVLDDYLPLHYTVPSGSRIRLDYAQSGNPVLSVRLQEMLGCAENPAIARGKVPLKVHLLSPAMRPVQVTEDIANFWTNSYPAVKKEMAGRYPKHVWPEDPINAQATAHSKRRSKPKGA